MDIATAATLPVPPKDILEQASLFLDFDGTLVELADRPDAVTVDARLAALMRALRASLDDRLAVISGRAAAQVCALFGRPDFTVAGSHGLEFHYADGRTVLAAPPEGLAAVLTAMHAYAADHPGVLVEEKPLGAALHFRQAPDAAAGAMALAQLLAEKHGLRLQSGKMMIEVRADAGDKGTALRSLMEEPPMRGGRPVMIGDDDTDEAAFAAAVEFGGSAILVGAMRETAAQFRLPDVAAVRAWLADAASEVRA